MKLKIFILSLIGLISIQCFAQKKDQPKKIDTLSVNSNVIQVQRLDAIDREIKTKQELFKETLELIFGYKIEEIEWWGFDKGKFKFILKDKK